MSPEVIFYIAYIVFLFVLFLAIVNWPAIRAFFIRVYDLYLAIAEAYCRYEEEMSRLTPEERFYLDNNNLFI